LAQFLHLRSDLVPGIGDAAASALFCWLLLEAYQLRVPHSLLARMIANVLVEGAAGAVPVAGDLFDIGWRASPDFSRNVGASGFRISESRCAAATLTIQRGNPDADRV
jgi:uncharacterized protein DUF4112